MQLSFDHFDTYAKIDNFVYDNVVVVDGNGVERMFSGRMLPDGQLITFDGDTIRVRFQSYFNQNSFGFSITATLVPKTCTFSYCI